MTKIIKVKPNILLIILAIMIFAGTLLVSCRQVPPVTMASESPETELEGPYSVTRIVDGDTIVVNMDGKDGKDTKIRLIGIDTPESVHPDNEKNTEEGRIASAYTEKLLTGCNVYLEFDSEYKDSYDRVLAYAYLEDGRMVNAILLEEGMASVYTVPPNTKYTDVFIALQKKARENNMGFWAEK